MISVVEVTVNGESRTLDVGTRLGVLVSQVGAEASAGRGFAVAVDGEVVPRADWSAFVLAAGQSVEILVAVQGG